MTRASDYPVLAKVEPDNPFFEIIEEAYRVFARPQPSSTGVCTQCCMDEAIEQDFFNPSIAELPLAYVQDWYFAAYDPEKGVGKSTWAYLLPRILEILAAGEDVASVGLEVALQRFETGNPENWRTEEWAILDAFQRLFLKLQVEQAGPFRPSDPAIGDDLDDVLCMFVLGGWEVDGLIRQLEQVDDAALARRLYRDWHHVRSGDGTIRITAFWQGEGRDKVWAFYTSQALHDRMARLALDGETDAELAEMAFRVANTIQAFQDSQS